MNWLKKQLARLMEYLKRYEIKDIPLPTDQGKTVDPAPLGCTCNLTTPVCDPPYSPKWLDEKGNAAECPVPHGMDIRGKCLYPSINQRYSLTILRQLVSGKDAQGLIRGLCPVIGGYQYHFIGYSHNNDKVMIPCKPGESFRYLTTTFVWHDCRMVAP